MTNIYTIDFKDLSMNDLARVGGKNASLGEMISHLTTVGVKVPVGFATTADAFQQFLAQDGTDQTIYQLLNQLNVDDTSIVVNRKENS